MKYFFVILLAVLLCTIKLPTQELDIGAMREKPIQVEVRGAVVHPGYYELPPNSTIEVLLNQAELQEDADLSTINRQIKLKDNDVLDIPYQEEKELVISINTADKQELMLLPGVGELTAQLIIDYRNTHGLFQTIDDLLFIKGIGPKKLEKIRPYVKL